MKRLVDNYGRRLLQKIDNVDNLKEDIKQKTNLEEIRKRLKKAVKYKQIYKTVNTFYEFKLEISKKCDKIVLEAYKEVEEYLNSRTYRGAYLDMHICSNVEMIISQLIFEPIWYGFVAEDDNIDMFAKMGIEVYTFDKEEDEIKFDDDYSIDHMIYLNGEWCGVQSKCRSYLGISGKKKLYYYDKHQRCLTERPKITKIYYLFYDANKPYAKCRLNGSKKIDGAELNGFLVPSIEVVNVVDNEIICNINYYNLEPIDYLTLFEEEEEEDDDDDIEDLPF